ncbi:carboxypeptidase-like regulatory domain-containing protein [Paraburkholderia sp. DHOC27]|uniref:carboxypeptidase-like regulatory domain-containing protein n=1 Tax=Paraburkholderia sp. DHOC27 TaxID=2303330 RepID=UPI000E3E77A7|nr:carboxypeptidase-like regulatory domain-containing protein [Paraburkholderia sp. DHOC27]RFU49623.1 carboxypeptidase regulatory-like domain-containing protein [Paraburkholderia sp. DHOC27]
MSTTLYSRPHGVRAALTCVLACALGGIFATSAWSAHAQRPQAPSEAVPSQLLSDDERIDFCTQMRRAATPEQRHAVTVRLHDTVTPRAQVQGVDLPNWVKEGQPVGSDGRLPGLSCNDGGGRPRVQAAAPVAPVAQVPEAPPRKSASRDSMEAKPVPSRDFPAHAMQTTPSPAQIPVRDSAPATLAAMPPPQDRPAVDAAPRSAAAGDIPVEQDNGVAYVTGGVGQDEASAMRGLAGGYNMRATFTTRSGEYLSGVNLRVVKAGGATVFAATSDGPYLFARLPEGHYRIIASVDGAERSRELYVPARGGVRFTLVWPSLRTTSVN